MRQQLSFDHITTFIRINSIIISFVNEIKAINTKNFMLFWTRRQCQTCRILVSGNDLSRLKKLVTNL